MGASPEALKKMETGMYKSRAVGMNTLAKDTVTMKTTSRGKREKRIVINSEAWKR